MENDENDIFIKFFESLADDDTSDLREELKTKILKLIAEIDEREKQYNQLTEFDSDEDYVIL